MRLKVLGCLFLSTLMFTSLLTSVKAAESDVYGFSWLDPDKEVYVLQNRKFRKAGRMYVNAGAGITTSGTYVDSMNIQGRLGFFMNEEFGLEVLYSKNDGKNNDAYKAATTANSSITPFVRTINDYIGAMVLWSPFYSKINTFNSIIYADYILGLGIAKLNQTNNKRAMDGSNDNTLTDESNTGIMWQFGMKFYINENWSIKPDFTAIHYQAENASGKGKTLNSNYDLTLSLGYTF